jgi:hypothetical protein
VPAGGMGGGQVALQYMAATGGWEGQAQRLKMSQEILACPPAAAAAGHIQRI